MKKLKTMIRAVLAAAVMLCLVFGASGCDKVSVEGPFYSLKEAYRNGYITKADLKAIAAYVNNGKTVDIDTLNDETLNAVKAAYAEERGAQTEDVAIKFYGDYNGCSAVNVSLKSDAGATVIIEVTIGGVEFIYPHSGAEVVIWKK